jgi:hypothetical protein
MQDSNIEQRRTAARKTAWVLAVIVLIIFVSFILSGVLSKA